MNLSTVWPFRHFGLKVWSVVLAVMLWMLIAGQETLERSLRVPLELQQFPAGLELTGDPPAFVDLRVRGESGVLSRVGAGDIVAVLDLRTARAGRRLYQITPEQIRVPSGVEVVQVMSPTLALVFENSATREVPVLPSIEGNPEPGFIVGKVTANPASVEVIGPESAVKSATEATTEPVSVAGARRDVTDTVAVGFRDPALRLKTPRPAAVTVSVLPGPVEKELHGRPIRLRDLGPRLSARAVPPTTDVVLRGSREGLNDVDNNSVTAFVDLAGLGAGDYVLEVHVAASPAAGVARINPATVQVRISSDKP